MRMMRMTRSLALVALLGSGAAGRHRRTDAGETCASRAGAGPAGADPEGVAGPAA